MAMDEKILEGMDSAAEFAKEQLKNVPEDHIRSVANWWKKHYLKSGHKRLAKVLLTYASKKENY